MRSTLAALVLTLFVTGCAEQATEPSIHPDFAAATDGERVTIRDVHTSLRNDCTGELIELEGRVQYLWRIVSLPSGHFHVTNNFSLHLRGQGTATGDEYNGSLMGNFTQTVLPGLVQTNESQLRLIGRGKASNLLIHQVVHWTITPKGEVVVDRFEWSMKCSQLPPPPDPGVRSVTVAPDGATIAIGATLAFTAAVTTDSGAAEPTITWSSSNVAIATVNATSGVATGVAAGSVGIRATATSGSSSASGVATLNVATSVTPATVSIQSIEQEGVPVNLNNLSGQVYVRVNLERGGEQVQTVQLLVDGSVVVEQIFGSPAQASAPQAAIEELLLPWNTAAFDPVTGVAKHINGPHALSAKVITAENESGTGSPSVSVTLNNQNTALLTIGISNGAVANSSNGELWYTGDATVTALPVIYTETAPDIAQVRFNPDGDLLNTVTDTEAPWSAKWAKGTKFADGGAGGNGNPGIEDDDFRVCITATVNGNASAGDLACTAPVRYDNQAPAAPTVFENPNGRQAGWVNDAVSFSTVQAAATPDGMVTGPAPLDAGVGGTIYRGRIGLDLAAAIAAADVTGPALAIPSATGTSYCLALYSVDALGNHSADPAACDTGDTDNNTLIGVDRAPPTIAYTAASLINQGRLFGGTLGGEFIVAVTDTNSGVLQPIPVLSNVIRRTAAGTLLPGDCVQGAVVSGGCTQSSGGLGVAPPLVFTGITGLTSAGYYSHTAKALDAAGNSAEVVDGRVIVYDATPATATPPAVPAVITGEFSAASVLNDDLSIRDFYFTLGYTTSLFVPAMLTTSGAPNVIDPFNAPTLRTLIGVGETFNAVLGLQATVGGVPQAYVPNSNPLSGVMVWVRDQAQPAYSASPVAALAPTPPATGVAVAGGSGPTAFVFATYTLATSQANICAGTLPAGCAAVPTSTVFSASASGTTGSFNNPFSQVNFYAVSADGLTLVFIGSVPAASAFLIDAGGLSRIWKYSLPMAAGALYSMLGGSSPAVLGPLNVYAFGVSASGLVALVSEPVAQTIHP